VNKIRERWRFVAESWFALSPEDQKEALAVAAAESGWPAFLLEKDIWVVWALQILGTDQQLLQSLTFKGGTSLSKAGAHSPAQASPAQTGRSRFNYNQRQAMVRARGVGTPQAVRLPAELLERIDLYAARLGGELHLSVSRSDALRRLLTLALEDAEDTAEAEAILRTNEPRVSWEELKNGSATPAQAPES
jgi:antitoxin component of MazEF toxin-antitoxin module